MKLSDMSPRARWAQAQVAQHLIDHPEGLRQPLTLALQRLDDIGAILTPERAEEIAAEARTAALLTTAAQLETVADEAEKRAAAEYPGLSSKGWAQETRLAADAVRKLAAPVDGEPEAPRTERSRWQAIADALNGVDGIGIDLDGTVTDHQMWSVVWGRTAERWVVAGYDEDSAPEGGEVS